MSKRISIAALCLLLVLSLFSGCGTATTSAAAETESSEPEVSAELNPPEEAPTEEVSVEEAADDSSAAEKTDAEEEGSQLPLVTDGSRLSVFWTLPTDNSLEDMNDALFFQVMEDRTGVAIDFISPTYDATGTQYNLLLASGDYPDIMYETNVVSGESNVATTYPGGYDAGITDGIFIALNDLVDQYAPNYKAYLESNDLLKNAAYTKAGNLFGFIAFYTKEQTHEIGPAIRQDWLDELGLDAPVTVEDWVETLVAFQSIDGIKEPMIMTSSGFLSDNALNTPYKASKGLIVEEGTVKYGPCESSYREYLRLLNEMYEKGCFTSDFLTLTSDMPPQADLIYGGSGIVEVMRSRISSEIEIGKESDPDYDLTPLPYPVLNEGDPVDFWEYTSQLAGGTGKDAVVTSNCENPELAVRWLDYFYSEEGVILTNYGVEDETFYYDENGQPMLNDMIVNYDKGMNTALNIYCLGEGPMVTDFDRVLNSLSDLGQEASKLWNTVSNSDVSVITYPTTISLNASESSSISAFYSDIRTYVAENTARFITGEYNLDADFDRFVNALVEMGSERVVEVYQQAYDRNFG